MTTSSSEHEPRGERKCHFLSGYKDGGATGLGSGNQGLGFAHVLLLLQNTYTFYHGIILNRIIHCPLLELFHHPQQKFCTHSTLPSTDLLPSRPWSSLLYVLSSGYVYLSCLLDIQVKILKSSSTH